MSAEDKMCFRTQNGLKLEMPETQFAWKPSSYSISV